MTTRQSPQDSSPLRAFFRASAQPLFRNHADESYALAQAYLNHGDEGRSFKDSLYAHIDENHKSFEQDAQDNPIASSTGRFVGELAKDLVDGKTRLRFIPGFRQLDSALSGWGAGNGLTDRSGRAAGRFADSFLPEIYRDMQRGERIIAPIEEKFGISPVLPTGEMVTKPIAEKAKPYIEDFGGRLLGYIDNALSDSSESPSAIDAQKTSREALVYTPEMEKVTRAIIERDLQTLRRNNGW